MQVAVIYYDTRTPKQELYSIVQNTGKVLGDEAKVIAIPKHYDMLLDCNVDQLYTVRNIIDAAIQTKMEDEDTDVEHIKENISKIDGYIH